MEYKVMDDDSVISGIKRRVKDKKISKTKLNVSLASKIKTKIINNSSILKISLKHNNRALAQALSREKENSRRTTTEKMLLQKEVEKLNFENTFLRLKLNNLNKKLIEIESLVNNNLITAIEMSSLAEFHQSSFLPSTSKKKRISKQCNLMRLPFARVPLTSNDDDDDDGDDGKPKAQCEDSVTSRKSPGVPSLESARRPSPSPQCDLEILLPEEDNQSPCDLDHLEHTSSTVDVLPKESHHHTDQSSRSSLVNGMKITLSTSPRRETPSLSNVTERKKRGSSRESKNPTVDTPSVTDLNHQQISNSGLNWNKEINACTNENNSSIHRDGQCFPASSSVSACDPNAESMTNGQNSDNFQLQKTVYEAADMDLTASDASKIIAVSKGIKNRSKKKPNCGMETFRKVKDPSSEKKRERARRKCKNSSDEDNKEKPESGPERQSIVIDDKRDTESPNFIFNTEQLTQASPLKKITLQDGFDLDDQKNVQLNKNKQVRIANEQEETYCFSQASDQFLQESQLNMCPNSLTCNNKSKVSRQTFVIHKLERDSLFSNPKDKDTISENLEVPNEFQTADLSAKDNENLHETQKMLDLKKYATVIQPTLQNTSKVKKLKQKINRRTKIISKTNQMYEDNNESVHGPEKGNVFHQPQVSKETVSGDLEVSKEFQIPIFTTEHGNSHECKPQNGLGLQNPITDTYPVQQNESKISTNFRQKVNRKTEIISEANHFNDDKSVHFSEKDNSLFLLKDKGIPGNLEDTSDFQTPVLCTKDSGKLCDYKTHTVCGIKKHVYDCQNDSEIDQKLRQRAHQKTEMISVINQTCESDDRGIHDLEENNVVSLTKEDRETGSENVTAHKFQTADLPTKYGNLCDQETQNVLDLQKHVTNMPLTQPDVSKLNKFRPKASMTKIISEMNHIYEDTDDVVNGQNYTNDLDFKINKSKQKLECQDIVSGYYMEIKNNENCDQIPDPHKLVKKRRQRSSSRAKSSLVKDKNRPSFQLPDSSQAPILFRSSLKHVTNESDSSTENHTKHPKNQKRKTVTLNTKQDVLCLEEVKDGNCPAKKVSKVTSKSKTRKTLLELSSVPLPERIPDTAHKRPLDSEQIDKENYLENEKIVKMKSDHCTKVFKPLSQICSPNIQNSSFDGMCESLIPLGITSSKNRMIEENFAPVSSPIFQVNDVEHEKIKEGNCKVKRRTQISEVGKRMLKDLTDTSFVSSNTANFDTELEDPPPELPRRKRKCAPANLKEPSLARKMRR